MRRSLFAASAAVVLVTAFGLSAAAAGNTPPLTPAPHAAQAGAPVALSASPASAQDDPDAQWRLLGGKAPEAPVAGAYAETAAAPAAAVNLAVALDVATQSQYWFWAYGVEVTASGFAPGERAVISFVPSTGGERSWAPVVADEAGVVVQRVRFLDLDPDNQRPALGLSQIRVTGENASAGSASLALTANDGEVLQVSTTPATISQDELLDTPVIIHATGMAPMEKVFFNLGLPDTSMGAIGELEGLHSDENGNFSYEIQAVTANSQVGTWLVGIQSASGLEGTNTFEVTAGAPRTESKTMTLAPSIELATFIEVPGLPLSVDGFTPFDTFEIVLTTPRGLSVTVGTSRTDGEGRARDSIVGPSLAPTGTYSVIARSTTTGDFATGQFTVVDGNPIAAPVLSLSPATATASELNDPARGVSLTGANLMPGTTLRVSLRNAEWKRSAFVQGADLYLNVAEDGTVQSRLVTLEKIAAGSYTVWATGGVVAGAYDYKLTLIVTDEGESVQPVAPDNARTQQQSAPQPAAPQPAAPSSPATAPAPVTAPVAPPAEEQPLIDDEMDGFGVAPPEPLQ